MRRASLLLAAVSLLPASPLLAQELRAVTEKYCTSCHNSEDWAGSLDLDTLDHAHLGPDAEVWEKVVLKLRAGMMPPPGKERPSRREIEGWMRCRRSTCPRRRCIASTATNTPMPSATCSASSLTSRTCCRRTTPATASTTWPRASRFHPR
jgi:hypothetical protein